MRCGKTPTPEEAASMIMELRRRDPAAAKRGHGVIGEKRQWMKLEQTYTTAEFRRDLAACTAGGAVNEECMKSRGWVMVIPTSTRLGRSRRGPQSAARDGSCASFHSLSGPRAHRVENKSAVVIRFFRSLLGS